MLRSEGRKHLPRERRQCAARDLHRAEEVRDERHGLLPQHPRLRQRLQPDEQRGVRPKQRPEQRLSPITEVRVPAEDPHRRYAVDVGYPLGGPQHCEHGGRQDPLCGLGGAMSTVDVIACYSAESVFLSILGYHVFSYLDLQGQSSYVRRYMHLPFLYGCPWASICAGI